MQKSFLPIVLLLLVLFTNPSCKKSDNEETVVPINKEVVAEKINVKTYEMIDLITKQTLSEKYLGTFGSIPVELKKTSDTTLSFYVPDIAEGAATLKFNLAKIDFNVSKTEALDAIKLINDINKKFDERILALPSSTPEEIADIEGAKKFRQEALDLFNSLTPDQKTQALLTYEANKAEFQAFVNNTFTNLDTTTNMRLQSECARTNFREFYDCTGENLGNVAIGLKRSSREFLQMLTMAGLSAYLAPASFGLSATGTVLGGGAAAYLLFAEVLPAAAKFKNSLFPYLEARWIFSKALFDMVVTDFKSQVSTGLNLTPKFHSLTSDDGAIGSGISFFISTMDNLKSYWDKLTAVFGKYPNYNNTETPANLITEDIMISNISNANVQYIGQTNQSITFKSLSGKDEVFTCKIKVSKEGFVEEKTLSAKVKVNCPTITFGTSMSGEGSIAILNVQGGVAPYMFSIANSTYQSSEIFVGPYVSGNSYLIKIKDVNNCETTETRVLSKDACANLATINDSRDGQTYKIVQIGNQTWMAENLRYSGNIPNITDNDNWINNKTGAWCYYNNDPANGIVYGKLYNKYAISNTNVCPAGWHVPSDAEWTTLTDFLGGNVVAPFKMAYPGTQYWPSPNLYATNSSCFSALPGGDRNYDGTFDFIGLSVFWWSSTPSFEGIGNLPPAYNWTRRLVFNVDRVGLLRNNYDDTFGASVRCVKD